MLFYKVPAEKRRIFVYLETLVLTASILGIGYFLNHDDPLSIHGHLIFLTGFLGMMALYYGTGPALLSLGIVFGFYFLYFGHLDRAIVLGELVLVLFFGEFHAYWKRKALVCSQENVALQERLEDLGQAFYALKISHDQLELNNILKPVSLRRSLLQVLTMFDQGEARAWQQLLVLLEKSYGINKMEICLLNESRECEVKAATGEGNVDRNDPLVQEAIESALPVYISQHLENEARYLAVIPSVYRQKVQALIVIEEMPFMAFTEDTMISVAFLFDYFFLMLRKRQALQTITELPEFGDDLRFEYHHLLEMYERYGVDSTFIVFRTDSELAAHRLGEVVDAIRRGLDINGSAMIGARYVHIVLVAFSPRESAQGLLKRIKEKLSAQEKEKLEVSLFSMKERRIFREFVYGEQ